MSKFADKHFWVDAVDRAFVSLAQGLLAGGVLETTGILSVDWVSLFSLAGSYALTSLLSSVAFRGGEKPGSDAGIDTEYVDRYAGLDDTPTDEVAGQLGALERRDL